MTGQRRALRWLAAGVLVLWCGVFLRAENTEKSMVRALILTPPTVAVQNWMVSLLYQFPEAAADASDAAARVQLCTGQGNTLQTALTEAERGLPRKASYRICEYLLLNAETTLKTIRQAETVLKEEPVQGLSARVLCMDLSGEELAAADGENELFPERLLQVVKEVAPQAPHLYESRNALLTSVLILTDGAIENAEEMLLLTETGNTRLTPAESQMAQLLLGQSGEHTFPLGSGQVTFRRCVVSVEAVEDGFAVTLTGQRRAGTALPTAAQCAALELLCVQTVQRCWENGYDLLDVAKDCVERQKLNAQRSFISLTYLGESARVLGNRDQLDELCQNLCDNAIRYNRPGGKVQLITSCTRDGHCTLTVKDNGIGIPKDAQSSVFERFYRVDKSRSKATGGTGLGLAIVKHIARIHNARIKLESEVNVGTTITVVFETAH